MRELESESCLMEKHPPDIYIVWIDGQRGERDQCSRRELYRSKQWGNMQYHYFRSCGEYDNVYFPCGKDR